MNKTDTLDPELASLANDIITQSRIISQSGRELQHIIFLVNQKKHTIMGCLHNPDEFKDKDLFVAAIKDKAEDFGATVIVSVMEGYALEAKDLTEYQNIMEQYGSLANYPGRLEQAIFTIETYDGNWMGSSNIQINADKSREFGNIEFKKMDMMSGRLCDILPSRSFTTSKTLH
jgi:hypothetical protein